MKLTSIFKAHLFIGCAFFCLVSSNLFAQQLIPNANFDLKIDTNSIDQVYWPDDWQTDYWQSRQLILFDSLCWHISSLGACRLFSKEILTPNNRKHCAAIIGYDPQIKANDFLQTKLIELLKKDSVYEFTMQVYSFSNCHRNFILAPQIAFLKNQQSKFHPNDLENLKWINANYKGFIIDTLGWVNVKYTYQANGNENFILIGNPQPFNKTKVLKIKSSKKCNTLDGLPDSKNVIEYFITNCTLVQKGQKNFITVPNKIFDSSVSLKITTPKIDTIILPEILFATDSFKLTLLCKNYLDSLFLKNKNFNFSKIIVEGYTDNKGSIVYNQQLSKQRAISVANYLKIELNVNDEKISVYGNGENKPIASNLTDEGRRKNRRVQIFIFKQ
jgi:outer membrane protein OmpA-like peptidoglycan-associated protein